MCNGYPVPVVLSLFLHHVCCVSDVGTCHAPIQTIACWMRQLGPAGLFVISRSPISLLMSIVNAGGRLPHSTIVKISCKSMSFIASLTAVKCKAESTFLHVNGCEHHGGTPCQARLGSKDKE